MAQTALALIFLVLGILAVIVVVALGGTYLYLEDQVLTNEGMVVEVNGTEYTGNGMTTGGNTTVVIMDGPHFYLIGIVGMIVLFFLLVWGLAAASMGGDLL